jgi:hypothetical protein
MDFTQEQNSLSARRYGWTGWWVTYFDRMLTRAKADKIFAPNLRHGDRCKKGTQRHELTRCFLDLSEPIGAS